MNLNNPSWVSTTFLINNFHFQFGHKGIQIFVNLLLVYQLCLNALPGKLFPFPKMTRQNGNQNFASRNHKDEFIQNYLMNEEVVVFGVDHSEDRKKADDLRTQIAALFSAHYGPGYDGGQDQGSGAMTWRELGDKLRRQCRISEL